MENPLKDLKLYKLFGAIILQVLSMTGGLSITQCTVRKNENTNKINALDVELNPDLYNKIKTVLSSQGQEVKRTDVDKITPDNFKALPVMATAAGENCAT